jgi:hypothetical protein
VCAHLLEQLEEPLLCSTVPLGYTTDAEDGLADEDDVYPEAQVGL